MSLTELQGQQINMAFTSPLPDNRAYSCVGSHVRYCQNCFYDGYLRQGALAIYRRSDTKLEYVAEFPEMNKGLILRMGASGVCGKLGHLISTQRIIIEADELH